ncbi:MBL fold metallo-hydrolase [Candidatus Aminicenantes bacterium AC-335-B20]|jgi:putative mRNA 3-end processing factor|nr:MBL fold metallo-hydrolase [SCandidatus Aminicenantes bacterium Aminicenantia_JdfR_composite]MCP2596702.1 MBL fold metallo-hydrolase [Candidatus Aminicenantes bacterium AC-335-G13]MCP2598945.1 MBL fold metallo-hydrolase [Candidatus Aminicenantes bacterium AC-335-B20]
MHNHILKIATIIQNGAVLIGKNVVCDAHVKRPIRIVTHIHWDHLMGLERSLKECENVLMTPISFDLLEILRGKYLNQEGKIKTLDYKEEFSFKGEKIKFFPAGHIFGSALVLLETEKKIKILYTGDFKYPPAEPVKTDILITEATYGNPLNVRKFKYEVEKALIDLVKESLINQPVMIFGFHGKLQRMLTIFEREKLSVPILLPNKIYYMAKVCEKYNLKLGEYILVESEEGQRITKGKEPFLALFHSKSYNNIPSYGIKINLTGWEFEKPIKRAGENEWIVALSDHSDFEQLLDFIKECKPEFVITDNYRVGDAEALSKEIEKKLKIPSMPLP